MKRIPLSILVLLLAACSAGEKARVAEFVPPADSSVDFGDLRVHYNALPTLSLNEAVAREYGVTRDAGSALAVIAARGVPAGMAWSRGGLAGHEALPATRYARR